MLADMGEVLSLFLIPVGGGIPAGVVLAQNRGLAWPVMTGLYFISDIILAFAFETLMKLFMHRFGKSPAFVRFAEAYQQNLNRMGFKYGLTPGPFSLIVLSFGVDPMTGRVVAKAAGHGFISGWALAITGDMFYFALIMASTLWLNSILGDGTLAATIVMVAMIVVPSLIRKITSRGKAV